MHAVVVDVSISDVSEGRSELHDRTIPAVSQAPGFVAGYWIQIGPGRGHSVIVLDSEEAANAMAERVRSNAPAAVVVDAVAVGEVVGHA